MPTAILTLELKEHSPATVVPEQYDHALILFRLRGQPVGQATLPVQAGQVDPVALRDALLSTAGYQLRENWLHTWLGGEQAFPTHDLPTATVAICTRDRTEDLARCLEGLMDLPDDGQEILVVDNCPSTDATQQLVARYEKVRYVREMRPGLDIARNRALAESQRDIVAFIDDDAVPDALWLRSLLRNFDDPMVLCVTGLTMPLELETEAQIWFERYSGFNRGFKRKVFHRGNINPLSASRVGAGANMAFRRSAVHRVGQFDEALDAGTPTCSGGDTEMFSRTLARGYRIVYDPAALNWHRHRRTWRELKRTIYGYGVGAYALWTRKFLFEREFTVPKLAWGWFRSTQLPALVRSLLKRPESTPVELLWAELRGCLAGPLAYLRARRQARRSSHSEASGTPRIQPWAKLGESANARYASLLPPEGAENSVDHPSVSLIIPTYNRSASLLRTLDALQTQTYPLTDVEVIVVADGCTDATRDVVRDYDAAFSLRLLEQANQGPAVARNNGASHAQGELLIFLDDDIEATPSFIAAHVQAHKVTKRVVIGYLPPIVQEPADFFQVELRGWWEAMFQAMREEGHRYGYWDLLSGNFSLPAVLFDQVGGFDASLRCHEDYELGLRLIEAGAEMCFVEQAKGYHYEITDLDRALSRKVQEGHADVAIARRHPDLVSTMPLAHFDAPWSRLSGNLRTLIFTRPGMGKVYAALLRCMMDLLAWFRLRGRWNKLLDALLDYWYWYGVAGELGEGESVTTLLQAQSSGEVWDQEMFEVDLEDGWEMVEELLDRVCPQSLRVRYGSHVVARIPQKPGLECLRGIHLRRLLTTDLAWPLLSAMELDMLVPYDPDHVEFSHPESMLQPEVAQI